MDAIKHHAREALDLVCFSSPKEDCQTRANLSLCSSVSKEALAFKDIVYLVGVRVTVDRGDLSGLPAGNAYRGVRRFSQEFLHVMGG